MLVAIEGVSGAGKSTLARELVWRLIADDRPVVDLAAVEQQADDPAWRLTKMMRELPVTPAPAEVALLFAARTAGRARLARRALAARPCPVVIADRLGPSLAVQLCEAGLDRSLRERLLALAVAELPPAATILLEVDHGEHVRRLGVRGHRPLDRSAFDELAESFRSVSQPLLVIDTSDTVPADVGAAAIVALGLAAR